MITNKTFAKKVDRLYEVKRQIEKLEKEAANLTKQIVSRYAEQSVIVGDIASGTVFNRQTRYISPQSMKQVLCQLRGRKEGEKIFMTCVSVQIRQANELLPAVELNKVVKVTNESKYVLTKALQPKKMSRGR